MSLQGRLNRVQKETNEYAASKYRKMQLARYMVRLNSLGTSQVDSGEMKEAREGELEDILGGMLRLGKESRERKGLTMIK